MTIADEAREVLADVGRAQDELDAVRREMEETVEDGGGHVSQDVAEAFRQRLEAAQEKVRRARIALRGLNEPGA